VILCKRVIAQCCSSKQAPYFIPQRHARQGFGNLRHQDISSLSWLTEWLEATSFSEKLIELRGPIGAGSHFT